jgi:hypothetical protein
MKRRPVRSPNRQAEEKALRESPINEDRKLPGPLVLRCELRRVDFLLRSKGNRCWKSRPIPRPDEAGDARLPDRKRDKRERKAKSK